MLRFFTFYPSQQKALAARPARARVRRRAARPLRPRDGASAVEGRGGGRAAARPPHAGVSDDRGARAGHAAQGHRAHACGRPRADGGDAAGAAGRAAQVLEVRRCRALPARAAAAPVGAHAARARRAHASSVDAPQVRRAARAAAVAQGAPQGALAAPRAGADGHRRAHAAVPRARAVQADARAGARRGARSRTT